MIGEILNAVLLECRALLEGTGAEVILKTNLKQMTKENYSGNFILLDVQDAPESLQYPGGLTRMDWKFGFNSYNFEPDAYVDDQTGYATSLLNFIDMIRQHFTNGLDNAAWLTQGMTDIFNLFGFQYTFGGVTVAEAVEADGFIMGYKIDMESTALDQGTLAIVDSSSPLQNVVQHQNEEIISIVTSELNSPFPILQNINSYMEQIIPGNTFVQSVSMKAVDGNPYVDLKSTLSDVYIEEGLAIGEFQRVITEIYFPTEGKLIFQVIDGSINVNIQVILNFL